MNRLPRPMPRLFLVVSLLCVVGFSPATGCKVDQPVNPSPPLPEPVPSPAPPVPDPVPDPVPTPDPVPVADPALTPTPDPAPTPNLSPATLQFRSDDIGAAPNNEIPPRFAACGPNNENDSPRLSWSWTEGTLPEVASFAIETVDLDFLQDGNPIIHWLVYDIPPNISSLVSSMGGTALPPGAKTAANETITAEIYDGPCPPGGGAPHRYEFRIWALDLFDLGAADPNLNKSNPRSVLTAIAAHDLTSASFIGTFQISVPAPAM